MPTYFTNPTDTYRATWEPSERPFTAPEAITGQRGYWQVVQVGGQTRQDGDYQTEILVLWRWFKL